MPNEHLKKILALAVVATDTQRIREESEIIRGAKILAQENAQR